MATNDFDLIYYNFEKKFRPYTPHLRRALEGFLPFFQSCKKVIDLGCGRGEFLELLRNHRITAIGIDGNKYMIKECERKNLTVIQSDVFNYLKNLKDSSIDGFYSDMLIEHLEFSQIIDFLTFLHQKLEKGGVILLTTPNIKSMLVSTYNFYLDPTHKTHIHPDFILFLLKEIGFSEVKGIPFSPSSQSENVFKYIYKKFRGIISRKIYGYQDIAFFARK